MSDQQVREKPMMDMIQHASTFCDKTFERTGEIAPMWHAVKSNGEAFVELHPMQLGKDMAAAMIRAQFDFYDVVRYLYIGEAWTVDRRIASEVDQAELMREARAGRLHLHPARVEIVQIQGEDAKCGQFMAQRVIMREKGRKPFLAPLEMVVTPSDGVQSSGRMVGMLPQRGTRQ